MPRIRGAPKTSRLRMGIEPEGYLDARELSRMLGVSLSHFYALMKEDPTFPPKYRFSTRRVRWKEEEILKWQQSRIQKALDTAAK